MSYKLKVQYWPIDDVKPYPNNPRNNDDAVEYVANSIREFSFQQPIVVDTDGTIIAGHTRLKAAKLLGMETVPVVVADNLTPAQVNAYRLADNKVAEAATWDMEDLAVELEGLEVDFDMTMFDFDLGPADWFSDRQRNDTSRQDGNGEYNDFLDKFEAKKTTDDCYTPDLVYDSVLDWVRNEYNISDEAQIVRPFYPNGDYEHENYPEGCIVVDNPPFSILTEIVRFFCSKGISFFIFAPTLTLFNCACDCDICYIATDYSVTYDNGAKVNTSFVTNMEHKYIVRTAPELYNQMRLADKENSETKPMEIKYSYPSQLITAAKIAGLSKYGADLNLKKSQVARVSKLDNQAKYGKAIFGSGFLVSHEAADAYAAAVIESEGGKAAARRARDSERRMKALETAKALGDGVEVEPDGSVVWRLSERELAIVEGLGK